MQVKTRLSACLQAEDTGKGCLAYKLSGRDHQQTIRQPYLHCSSLAVIDGQEIVTLTDRGLYLQEWRM